MIEREANPMTEGSLRMTSYSRNEKGFTLPELLVVCAIIGILAAIAVPTFWGSKASGYDSRAQNNLRSALAAERTYYVDFQTYTTNAGDLDQIEPGLDYSSTDAEADGVMAATEGSQAVVLVSTSGSGSLFCIMNIAEDLDTAVNGETAAGTYYLKGPSVESPPTSVTTGQCGTEGYERSTSGWSE
jgi:prepilin-type N-terminal cleavage/methylation domain-containing protein